MTHFTKEIIPFISDHLQKTPGNYLEIGVYDGEAIAYLSDFFPNKQIYAIDPFIEDGNTSWHSKTKKGDILQSQKQSTFRLIKDKTNIVFFEMTSQHFNANLTNRDINKYNINIVFIDGDHHYDHAINDLNLAIRLLNNKPGIILIDDTHVKDVKKAQKEFELQYKTKIIKTINVRSYTYAYFIQ